MPIHVPRWGIATTIKAPASDILDFCAYHLDIGASHIFVHLDDDNPDAEAALADNPKITAIRTDEAYWQATQGRRPEKHQVRQTRNASRTYRRAKKTLDWLAHIDVDEFICSDQPLATLLADLPRETLIARLRPAESLCVEQPGPLDPDLTYCKAWIPPDENQMATEAELYPKFGGLVKSGFIGHNEGKLLLRTGLRNIRFAIHRAFVEGEPIEAEAHLTTADLCHRHIRSWEDWQAIMDFRMTRGSYRPDLGTRLAHGSGRIPRNALFSQLMENEDDTALRAFFEEMCLATPELIERLRKHDLLRVFDLDLATKRARHFPRFTQ